MSAWNELQTIQPIASKILQNSIEKQRIAHAYLFHGPKGTGKKEASLLFAMCYFCDEKINETTPCMSCVQCKRIQSGNHPDVHLIEPEGQSIKKEQIHFLQKEFTYSGLESNRKVYIVLEAEKMTSIAQNRLLKFLEEPSQETVAILLTDHLGGMLDTIISRCQRIPFNPLSIDDVASQYENEGLPKSSAKLFAALQMEYDEALSINEADWFGEARKLMVQLVDKVMNPSDDSFLFLHITWLKHFKERKQIEFGLDLLLLWYKDLVSLHLDQREKVVYIDQLERLEQFASVVSLKEARHLIYEILQAKRKLAQNVHSTLTMEHLLFSLQR